MQQWLQEECVASTFDKRSFQDLRQQLSRRAVEMCDCWSQVHVDGDTPKRWGLLYELLCVEIGPNDTLAASVDTCCGCDVLRPLRADAYAGDLEEEEVDYAASSDHGEESPPVSSQEQPLSPGLPPSPGFARRSDLQTEALPRGGDAPAWRGWDEARWDDAWHGREQATSSRPSRLLPEGNPQEVRLRSKHTRREQNKRAGWRPRWSTASSSAQTWSYPKRHCRAPSSEEWAKRREPRTFHTGDNRFAPKKPRGRQPGRQFACDSCRMLQALRQNRLPEFDGQYVNRRKGGPEEMKRDWEHGHECNLVLHKLQRSASL